MKWRKIVSQIYLFFNCFRIYESASQNYCKSIGKKNGKEKGVLPKFERNLQHMKVTWGLKVGLEKHCHGEKKVCASRS
jgi:hypothetical protein